MAPDSQFNIKGIAIEEKVLLAILINFALLKHSPNGLSDPRDTKGKNKPCAQKVSSHERES